MLALLEDFGSDLDFVTNGNRTIKKVLCTIEKHRSVCTVTLISLEHSREEIAPWTGCAG